MKKSIKERIIGTWRPTHYASIYTDDSIEEIAYETFNQSELTFSENGIVTFLRNGSETVKQIGKWILNGNMLSINWGNRTANEVILGIDEGMLKKGNYYNNFSNGYVDTSKTLNYNKYEKIGEMAV